MLILQIILCVIMRGFYNMVGLFYGMEGIRRGYHKSVLLDLEAVYIPIMLLPCHVIVDLNTQSGVYLLL